MGIDVCVHGGMGGARSQVRLEGSAGSSFCGQMVGDSSGSDQIWLQWWQQGEDGRIRALYLRLGD